MPLELHNTFTGKRERFSPQRPDRVGLYVCGITPYDESHVGHARCYVVFDVLKRVLTARGYRVLHVQNYTDVDDKIIDRARRAGVPADRYSEPFIASFERQTRDLNILPADVYPRVTTHMAEIIALIQRLVERGLAYATESGVYFSVRAFPSYGALSKRKVDELLSGARVEVDEKKQSPADFALWKRAKPGEPAWPSPWGEGRPGWHIECSAMSMKYLGETFDLHGGGQDLIFPHHENEIAQSSGATGSPFARVWVHNGFVTVNEEKMSKSLGNFFVLRDVLAQYEPMVVRYFLLSQHYRSPLNFSDVDLKAAETVWKNRVVAAYHAALAHGDGGVSKDTIQMADFDAALDADINTPAALAVLNQLVTEIFQMENAPDPERMRAARVKFEMMADQLGLRLPKPETWPADVLALVDDRETARREKNWKRSDEVRDQLKERGVVVEDTANGPRLKRL